MDSPNDTATAPAVPFWATAAWLAAVQAAAWLCQCAGACGRKHRATGGACDQRQGLNGTNLHLAEDGKVYCPKCFADIAKALRQAADAEAAEADAARYAQDDLFALLGEA